MVDLTTKYLGLQLDNPIIIASSGLTNSVEKIEQLAKAGAGAIVLKSLYEEQMAFDVNQEIAQSKGLDYPGALDYIQSFVHNNHISDYFNLIQKAKKRVKIPIIASINCYSNHNWNELAIKIETAGADAIELNVFVVQTDRNATSAECEQRYLEILESVLATVKIPVVMKIGYYFSNLVGIVNQFKIVGASGVVLFNRFYEPDINISNLTITSSNIFSSPEELRRSLRWMSIISSKVPDIDFSASTGIHNAEGVIKQLLVGATTVQMCSAIYKSGNVIIDKTLNDLKVWMSEKGYSSIDDFRGIMNYSSISDPQLFERSQFIKYFGSVE